MSASVQPAGLEPRLRAGIAGLGLSLDDARVHLLLEYLALVGKWNRVYNLTALREPQEMLTHHLLDSLAVLAPLRRQIGEGPGPVRLLDVGSGAGLPGVVLAICLPSLQVDCVDTVAKKAAFIQQVAATLKLPHLRGIHDRVERLGGPYDLICSRAFASLPDFVALSEAALAPGGVWMAMKGRQPEAEMAGLPPGVSVFHVEPLQVPDLQAERCLVWMKKDEGRT